MTLTQITKIRGAGIHTTSNIVSHNINSSGIITAVAFKGPFTGSSNIQSGIVTATKIDLNGDIDVDGHTNLDNVNVSGVATFASAVNTGALTATTGTFSGNVSIGGTLTYEDVTNIDSVGIITARDGLKVLAGGANVVGVVTATSFVGGLPITSGADNRVITASSASAIQGETNLYFNGTSLSVGGSNVTDVNLLTLNGTGASTNIGIVFNKTNSPARAQGIQVSNTTGDLIFYDYTASRENLRINTDGNMGLGITPDTQGNTVDSLQIGSATNLYNETSDDYTILGNNVYFDGTNNKYIKTQQSSRLMQNAGEFTFQQAASGSADANITYTTPLKIAADSNITQTIDTDGDGFIITAGSANIKPMLTGISNRGAVNNTIFGISGKWSSNEVGRIAFEAGADTTNKDDGHINFYTRVSGGSLTSRFHINSSGHLKIGTAAAAGGRLYFESTSGAAQYIASGGTNNQDLLIGSSAGEFVRITSDGTVKVLATGDNKGLRIHTNGGISATNNELRFNTGQSNGFTFMTNSDGGSSNERFRVNSNGIDVSGDIDLDNGGSAGINFRRNGTLKSDIEIGSSSDQLAIRARGSSGFITFHTNTSTVERLRIKSDGKTLFSEEIETPQDYPTIKPTLDLNFAATKTLDSRISYHRYGPASYIDANGKVVLVGEDVPRFDHDPDTGECKGLLVEGERINYFPNGVRPGDKFNHSKAGTFTENTTETTAPDGSYTATKWTFTNNDPYLYHNQTLNAGVTYTMSMWVKAGTNMAGDVLQFRMGGGPYSTNANSTIPADGSWKRLTFTKTIGGSNETNANIGFEPQTNPSGNPASGDVIYIWGAQLESGNSVSSFIPTYGYTQMRGADVATIEGEEFTEWYNDLEGTIFTSHSVNSDVDDNSNSYVLEIGDAGSTHVAFRLQDVNNSFSNKPSWGSIYSSSSTARFTGTGTFTRGNNVKSIMSGKSSDFAGTFNGETVQTDTSGSFFGPGTTGVMSIGRYGPSTGYELEGHIQRIMYWPKQLTDTQLVTLTS